MKKTLASSSELSGEESDVDSAVVKKKIKALGRYDARLAEQKNELNTSDGQIDACSEDDESDDESVDDDAKDRDYYPIVETSIDFEREDSEEDDEEFDDSEQDSEMDQISEEDEFVKKITEDTREEQRQLEKQGRAFNKALVNLEQRRDASSYGECLKQPHKRVMPAAKGKKDRKKYACFICIEEEAKKEPQDRKPPKLFTRKIVQHLINKHPRHKDVIKIKALPAARRIKNFPLSHGHQLRIHLIDLIRSKGAFEYNNVLKLNDRAPVLTARRPRVIKGSSDLTLLSDYRTCPGCKGFFKKGSLKRHLRRCVEGVKSDKTHSRKFGEVLGNYIHPRANECLKRAYKVMEDDIIGFTARCDFAITLFGNNNAMKHAANEKNYVQVRSDTRMLARIVMAMSREEDKWKKEGRLENVSTKINELADVFYPHYYDLYVHVAQEIGGLAETTKIMSAPNSAKASKRILVNAIDSYISYCNQNIGFGDHRNPISEQKLDQATRMKHVLNDRFKKMIKPLIAETETSREIEKGTVKLPSVKDINLLMNFAASERDAALEQLKKGLISIDVYLKQNLSFFNYLTAGGLVSSKI